MGNTPYGIVVVAIAVLIRISDGRKLTSTDTSITPALIATDYIQFYDYKNICLLRLDSEPRSNRQLIFILRTWARSSTFSVLKVINKHSFNTHSINSTIESCKGGLVILHLHEELDVQYLNEVFPLAATSAEWLLLSSRIEVWNWLSLHSYFPLNSRVIVALYSKEDQTATLQEVYSILPEWELKILPVGAWNMPRNPPGVAETTEAIFQDVENIRPSIKVEIREMMFGLLAAPTNDLILHRKDLNGLHLKCSAMYSGVRLIIKKRPDGSLEHQGILSEIVKAMELYSNFTLTCYEPADNAFGNLVDGKWTGLVKDVVTGTADLAVANLDMTYQRSLAVDFLLPIFESK